MKPFCDLKCKTTFWLFAKVAVNAAHPQGLKEDDGEVNWNFNK